MIDSGDLDEFDNTDAAYDSGEQYANSGLDIWAVEANVDDDEATVFFMIHKLDKKYAELFCETKQ